MAVGTIIWPSACSSRTSLAWDLVLLLMEMLAQVLAMLLLEQQAPLLLALLLLAPLVADRLCLVPSQPPSRRLLPPSV